MTNPKCSEIPWEMTTPGLGLLEHQPELLLSLLTLRALRSLRHNSHLSASFLSERAPKPYSSYTYILGRAGIPAAVEMQAMLLSSCRNAGHAPQQLSVLEVMPDGCALETSP